MSRPVQTCIKLSKFVKNFLKLLDSYINSLKSNQKNFKKFFATSEPAELNLPEFVKIEAFSPVLAIQHRRCDNMVVEAYDDDCKWGNLDITREIFLLGVFIK